MIAYEPEAAALFCKQLPTDRMAANDEPIQFVADQPYIVVDLGGRYWRICDRFFVANNAILEIHIHLMHGMFLKAELQTLRCKRFHRRALYTICTKPQEVPGVEIRLTKSSFNS